MFENFFSASGLAEAVPESAAEFSAAAEATPDRAHAHGLSIAQKNADELADTAHSPPAITTPAEETERAVTKIAAVSGSPHCRREAGIR